MVKAVLFDFDGTLADSSAGIFHTALYTVRKMGIEREYSDDELRRFVGPPLRRCFVEAFGMDESLLDEAVRIYREEYTARGMRMMHLYPGMKELLEALRGMGIKTGVASFKAETLVISCLDGLGVHDLFSAIHGSDLAGTLTKGDIIELAIKDLGVDRECVLMVGDTENDRLGAEAAGVQFLAVTYGFGYRSASDVCGFSASSAGEILSLVKRMNGGDMIEKVETKSAPAAIGPYSQAVKANGMVFASGQIPIDPATGEISGKTAAEQARQVFSNVKAVLAAAGTDIAKVVKATVFLADMADFGAVNEVYAEAFKDAPVLPARSAVAVKTLPKNVQVEVEVIALQ